MKRLQRRTKRNNITSETSNSIGTNVLSTRVNNFQQMLSLRWQALSPRDQLALAVLSIFLLLFIGGYGGYSIHQAANDSKRDYQEQVADYFWLRAQAGNIDSNAINAANTADGEAAMPPANIISALLNNSGIANAQVVATGDAVQLSFNHASQAVVSTALGKLEQQGWQFTQLSIQQDLITKAIQVQATVTS
ncbi:type II secretion system protein GspM [Psychrobacter sp. 1044]|uniref:type II secretion system protein GspM n=1 Tax=Psychrobacter sp. 1044 TaxID=2772562 RepID=UPI00191B6ABA|nr:type II secretion system protein GspM [Psychrobacter sp. 1044]